MSYRPLGWKNPYIDKKDCWEHQCFERGADAMIEALKKEGKYIDASKYSTGYVLFDRCPIGKVDKDFKGWISLIPDK